jgi:hypothetical protein
LGADIAYYDKVSQITTYYYGYQTQGLLLLTEAYNYRAWEDLGSPDSGGLLSSDNVASICAGGSPTLKCTLAKNAVTQLYSDLKSFYALAGAPYTNDHFLLQYSSDPRLWVKSLEDFTLAAGDACPDPLTSNHPCGVTSGLWNQGQYPAVTYRGYTDWSTSNAGNMNILLSGWTSGTPGNYLENTLGFENMQNKILLTKSSVSNIYLIDSIYPTASASIVDAVVFVDPDIDKSKLDQPVQTQDAFRKLIQSKTLDTTRSCYIGMMLREYPIQDFTQTDSGRTNWDSCCGYFYKLHAQMAGLCLPFTWDSKPGWLADNTGANAKQYHLIYGYGDLFTDCTEGRSSKNVAGVWTMCGDDFSAWFEEIVPNPAAE